MSAHAQGKMAFGFCDRCGFRYDLVELKMEIYNQVPTGLRACDDCLDEDHPQLQLGKANVDDPQSLANPRPDTGKLASQSLFGWRPVGHPLLTMTGSVGTVTIVTR